MDDGPPVMAFGGLLRCPLQAGTIEFFHRELIRVDAVEATHVDHDHVFATRFLAVGVRLDAAGRAEWMMNNMFVELEIRHRDVARDQLEVRCRSCRK